MKSLLATLCFCLLATVASASTWYIDGNAAGSHNGTSWANAWKTMGAITGISAGDTVFISGGSNGLSQTYTLGGPFPFVKGTASNSPTTYQIGQDPSHNGVAIFDCGGGAFFTGNMINVTISGNAGDSIKHFAATDLAGVDLDGAGTYISNTIITYIDFGASVGAFYYKGNLDNFEFSYNRIFKLQDPNAASDGDNYDHVFSYNNTDNFSGSFNWIRIHHNAFYSPRSSNQASDYGDDFIATSMACIHFYNNLLYAYPTNYIGTQHQDGFQCQWCYYTEINNNTIVDSANSGMFPEPLSLGLGCNYLAIFNNIIESDNSLFCGSPMRGIDALGYDAADSFSYAIIANNLVIDLGTASVGAAFGIRASGQGDGATYYNSIVANNVLANTFSGYTLDSTLAWTGDNFNDNSVNIGTNFVRYTTFGGSNNNLNITANSEYRHAGTNLTQNLIGIGVPSSDLVDMNGNKMPATGNWDVGPYQYVGASMPPPTRLTITGANLSGVSVQ
jgi:hypothetical protein